jgi:biotin operon repressor
MIEETAGETANENQKTQQRSPLINWVSEEQMREILKLSRTKLWQLRRDGLLRFSRLGKHIFYDLKSLQQLLEKNVEAPGSFNKAKKENK